MSIITEYHNVLNSYIAIKIFFFQKIKQSVWQNQELQNSVVDYNLLLPGSAYLNNLKASQVDAQLQSYILQCDKFIAKVKTNVYTQTNLQLEQMINTVQASIAVLSQWGKVLLTAQQENLISYITQRNTSMSEVLFITNIPLSSYWEQVKLNRGIDFNNIPINTQLTLLKTSSYGE